jgi:hypothetical protein
MLPRYRTLDGDEVELPLAMDRWVLVPRALARFDPELAWALDYEDAPEPADADPRLDFSAGALLVPVERWDEHAVLEPNLAPCRAAAPFAAPSPGHAAAPLFDDEVGAGAVAVSVAGAVVRVATFALAVLAVGYVVAVGAWLWSLRHRVAGPDIRTGLLLIGAAMLLAWLAGIAGSVTGAAPPASVRGRSGASRGVGIGHRLAENPVAILRLGLVVQLAGFFAFLATR